MKRIRSATADVVGQPRMGIRAVLRSSSTGVVAVVAWAGLVSACGSSSSSPSSRPPSSEVAGTCTEVSAVLSDGPDPGADPVGYAQAQILPLGQIHSSDQHLQSAIDHLASAYHQVSTSNGAATANKAASRALAGVDAICPGAGS